MLHHYISVLVCNKTTKATKRTTDQQNSHSASQECSFNLGGGLTFLVLLEVQMFEMTESCGIWEQRGTGPVLD